MRHMSSKSTHKKSLLPNIRSYGLKSVFFRYFFSSICIIFIIFLPFLSIAVTYYNDSLTREISDQAMASTTKSKSIFDVLAIEFSRNYDIACNNTIVKSFLDARDTDRLEASGKVQDVYSTIIPLLKSSQYVSDIFIYSMKSNYVISSHYQKTVLKDLKPEWLKTYSATHLNYFMIPRKKGTSDTYNVIYTCQTILDRGEVVGLFCTEMNYGRFEELVQKVFTEDPDKMYIVSDIGLILYSENPELINTSVYMERDASPIFDTTKKITDSTFLQDGYIISLARNDESHLIIMSYLNRARLTHGLSGTILTLALLSIGAFIAAILLALYFSFRHYRSIATVLDCLDNPDAASPLSDKLSEIYDISNTILNISHSNREILDELSQKAATLKEAQIAALQAQINPHFLFNALQLISLSIIKEVKADNTATRLISDLSALLRTTYDTENYIVPIQEEIEITQKYLSIQQTRYKLHLHLHYDIDESCLGINTVKLILQPLVENSIVHGFKGKKGDWNIQIRCFRKNDRIVFQVSDDGYGIPSEQLKEIRRNISNNVVNRRASIGITNVCQRIRLVYGAASEVRLDSGDPEGTTVTISHPVDVP